jgi:LysR family transcriptional regulator, nitrogen assimilation regulatory protein
VRRASNEIGGLVRIGLPLTAALADGLPGILVNEFTVNGRIDIGVLPGNPSATGISAQAIVAERLAVVTSPESILGRSEDPLRLAELKGQPLVLPNIGNRVRDAVDAGFASIGIIPTVVAEMNSIRSLCATAAAGVGSAIVPYVGARHAGHRLTVRLLMEPELERPLYIAISTAAPLSAAGHAIYSLIIDVAEGLVETGKWPGARWTFRSEP